MSPLINAIWVFLIVGALIGMESEVAVPRLEICLGNSFDKRLRLPSIRNQVCNGDEL